MLPVQENLLTAIIDLNLHSTILGEEDLVADLHIHLDKRSALGLEAGADSRNGTLVGSLLVSGDEDASGSLDLRVSVVATLNSRDLMHLNQATTRTIHTISTS